jgi:hypothetical protein
LLHFVRNDLPFHIHLFLPFTIVILDAAEIRMDNVWNKKDVDKSRIPDFLNCHRS